jgi:serine/threonine protein kinase
MAAAILAAAGWWVDHSVEVVMRQQRADALTTILKADVAALQAWTEDQKSTTVLLADDDQLQALVQQLLPLADDSPMMSRRLLEADAQVKVRTQLEGPLRRWHFEGFIIASPTGTILAADQDAPVGQKLPSDDARKDFRNHVFKNGPAVSRPFRSGYLLQDDKGQLRPGLPTMFAAAPLSDPQGKLLGLLGLRIRPKGKFTEILQVARFGESGETYAFDRHGLFLSQSKFDDNLKQIGLLADTPDTISVLTLEVRDPGVNMAEGERPAARRADQPLTAMAAAAMAGGEGNNPDGYRNYRGVPVVGAWKWLEDYDMGIATEVEQAEAFQPVYILRRVFRVMIGLLFLAAAAIFIGMWFIQRQQRALQKATLEAKHLGQYTLEEKLGAGGMGTVYKARHAMLRRPTAVKLLDVEKMSDAAVARFEREVQLTSALTHPNTVSIFDYGRTPEGIFYYAMEYLEGMTLDDLVHRFGALPEARVVHIMRQICGALAEAHAGGLVHRDVKPANIFLTCRGGLYDFVKVLDFGLVKNVDAEGANVTSANAITGTPLYLSPEAVEHADRVDSRSDVYAIGAVSYFLLTGGPVFTGESVVEICMKHVRTAPEPLSVRAGRPISPDLEALVLRCLAKSRSDRPADAITLLRELDRCNINGHWTHDDAAAWWAAYEKNPGQPTPPPSERPALSQTPSIDVTTDYTRGTSNQD